MASWTIWTLSFSRMLKWRAMGAAMRVTKAREERTWRREQCLERARRRPMLKRRRWQYLGGISRAFPIINYLNIIWCLSWAIISSTKYQWLIFIMLLKWSQEQDQELHRVIRRHGTSNWALIRKHFKGNRSRDSVIKRWHGKLKFQKYVPIPEKTKKISNDRKKQPQRKKAAVNRRAAPKATKKPENAQPGKPMKGINVRSQRLRSMIENSEPKKGKDKQAAPVEPIQSVQTEKASERPMEEEGPGFPWSRAEDERLLGLVLKEGIFNWGRLGSRMGCSQKEAKDRWRKSIYDLIKLDDKVGGFLKYSAEEDAILTNGFRSSLTWGELMDFLPGRSEFSIEARWRRLLRPELEVELSKNKHYIVRQFLKRVVERRQGEHALVEEPALSEPSSPKHP